MSLQTPRIPIAVCLLAVAAWPAHAEQDRRPISTSDDLVLTEADYRQALSALPKDEAAGMASQKTRQLQFALRLHSDAVLAQKAQALQLDQTPRVAALLAQARRNILVTAIMEKTQRETRVPELDELARERYSATRDAYAVPERRRAAHILITDLKYCPCEVAPPHKQVLDLRRRIEQGEKFATLAAEYSHDAASAQRGGTINAWIESEGAFDDRFTKAVFALGQVGDLSQPIESRFGWHLIELVEIDEARVLPYEEVEDRIKLELRQEILSGALERLRGNAYPDPNTVDISAIEEIIGEIIGDIQ